MAATNGVVILHTIGEYRMAYIPNVTVDYELFTEFLFDNSVVYTDELQCLNDALSIMDGLIHEWGIPLGYETPIFNRNFRHLHYSELIDMLHTS